MTRSEELASVCQPLWELRAGHRRTLPPWFSDVLPATLDSPLIQRILDRLEEFAARWEALPAGGSITLLWPLDGRVARRRRANDRVPGGDRRRLAGHLGEVPGRFLPLAVGSADGSEKLAAVLIERAFL